MNDSSLERPCQIALNIRRDVLEATIHEAAQSPMSVAGLVGQPLRKELEGRHDFSPRPHPGPGPGLPRP